MAGKKYLAWFEEISKEDTNFAGGKGANLGEMTRADLPIPYGFVVSSFAFKYFLEQDNLSNKIQKTLSIVNFNNKTEIEQASEHIQDIIRKAKISKDLVFAISEYYEGLLSKEKHYFEKRFSFVDKAFFSIKNIYENPAVAVRSSSAFEDSEDMSSAGQQDSFLNVKGSNNILNKIKDCWASFFSTSALIYRNEKNINYLEFGQAVVIQRMVQADKSGVSFSIDPILNDKNKIIIEAVFGLGEYISHGHISPDHYVVDKNTLVILKKQVHRQESKFIRSSQGNREIKLNRNDGSSQKLSDNQIREVALLAKDIESHYYFPQDIEWAIEKGRIFVVQSRPVTTINNALPKENKSVLENVNDNKDFILEGIGASPGMAVGHSRIIKTQKDLEKVEPGEVVVAEKITAKDIPSIKKVAAIITEGGGRTSHTAIICREFGIPMIVGAKSATKLIKNGSVISVNSNTGEVFKGSITRSLEEYEIKSDPVKEEKLEKGLSTITKIYVSLGEPGFIKEASQMDADGVGLLRAEFIINEIGMHPKEFIKQKQEKVFINKLEKGIKKFAEAFPKKPVIYRAMDFSTNDFLNLKAGALYEEEEDNPAIGLRGAARYVANPDVFEMELEAIKKIWESGLNNLHLMIPFVRVPWEMVRIKDIVRDHGLFEYDNFKLHMMVEVPAAAMMLDEFIELGVGGVVIGTNDLAMMILGADRGNSSVANIFDERHPAVVRMIEEIVEKCDEAKIDCIVAGEAVSDYPEIVENLVRKGVAGLSVEKDSIKRVRALVHKIEKDIYSKK